MKMKQMKCRSKIIAFANNKGGVGKTTTSANIAYLLSKKGKTLIVDLDPQRGISDFFGVDNSETIYSIINEIQPVKFQIRDNLYIICGDERLNDFVFKKNYLQMIDFQDFEYIVLDCPCDNKLINYNAIQIADFIICVSKIEPLSLYGIQRFNEFLVLANKQNKCAILFNQHSKAKKISSGIIPVIKNKYTVLNTTISDNSNIMNSTIFKKTVCEYSPYCKGAKDYRKLLNEILTKI